MADPDDYDNFMILSAADKLNTLYHEFSEFSTSLKQGFSRTSLRISDELEGASRSAVLDAFFSVRDACHAEGGLYAGWREPEAGAGTDRIAARARSVPLFPQ